MITSKVDITAHRKSSENLEDWDLFYYKNFNLTRVRMFLKLDLLKQVSFLMGVQPTRWNSPWRDEVSQTNIIRHESQYCPAKFNVVSIWWCKIVHSYYIFVSIIHEKNCVLWELYHRRLASSGYTKSSDVFI